MLKQIAFWFDLTYKMMRVRTVLMMLIFAAVGALATNFGLRLSLEFLWLFVILGALFTYATSLNDVSDYEIDKINLAKDKSRPMVNAGVSKQKLLMLAVAAAMIALGVSYLLRPMLVYVSILLLFLAYIYSMPPVKISYRGIWAIILLPINYVLIPFLLGGIMYNGSFNQPQIILLAGLYVSFIGRILLKDFRDVKGDKKFGKRTFLVRYGAVATCWSAILAWLAGNVIISNLLISEFSLFVLLVQPFVIAIAVVLALLSKEKNYTRQLFLVTLVGRLGNAVIMMLLTVLTLRAYDYSQEHKARLLLLVTFACAFLAYEVYSVYIKAPNIKNALGKR